MDIKSKPYALITFMLALVIILGAAGPSFAWTEATHRSVAEDALLLLPPALGELMAPHHDVILREAAAGTALHGKRGKHLYDPADEKGDLVAELERAVRDAVASIAEHKPMEEVALRLGLASHLVSDLAAPFRVSGDDPKRAELEADFDAFAEKMFPKFRPTFVGYTPGFLSNELKPALRDWAAHARERHPLLVAVYYPKGERVASSTFTVRSTAFGVASIGYSQAITTTARVWTYIWHKAGGDMKGTPYLSKENF